MIICIQEYPEDGDQAAVWFVDIDILDDGPTHTKYKKIVQKAIKNPDKCGTMTHDDSIMYGAGIPTIDPPCHIEDSITLYI